MSSVAGLAGDAGTGISAVIFGGIAVVLGLSALLATIRIVRGPSVLDRAVASEVLVASLVCALATEAALDRYTTTLPIVISLSLVGFLASVGVARFMGAPPGGAGPDDVAGMRAEEGR